MAEQRERVPIERYKSGRKKKGHSSYILLYIILVIVAIIALVVLSLTVFFPITNVEIKGASIYSAKDITNSADITMNQNLFTTDLSGVEENIVSKLPYIESVEVHRSFPSTITLVITKADDFAQIEYGGKYICIDKVGKCLAVNDKYKADVPVVRGSDIKKFEAGSLVSFNDDENITQMRCISDILISAKNNSMQINVVNIDNTQNLWATYSNKIVLLFGSDSNMEKKFQYAVATLKERENQDETGTLNLSRIPNSKNQASFIPGALSSEQTAG